MRAARLATSPGGVGGMRGGGGTEYAGGGPDGAAAHAAATAAAAAVAVGSPGLGRGGDIIPLTALIGDGLRVAWPYDGAHSGGR